MPTLTEEHIQFLSRPFSDNEIQEATFSPHPLKSPGPDGMPPIFYQKNWEEFKQDVCE